MTGTIKKVTLNYSLRIPIFDSPGWGREMERNFDILDAVIFANSQFGDIRGPWQNSTLYLQGDRVVDDEGQIWECALEHTSASSGTFRDEYTAHPEYWDPVTEFVMNKGFWLTNYNYKRNSFIEDDGRFGVAKNSYTSGASYDDDVTDENIVTLINLRPSLLAAQASASAAALSEFNANAFATDSYNYSLQSLGYRNEAEGFAGDAEDARDTVLGLYVNLQGGTSGQVLAKTNNSDFQFSWVDVTGGGDMLKGIYDPQAINSDVFDRANHTGTQDVSTITGLDTALASAAPPGAVVAFAMNTAPTGWIKCNGAAVSRATFSALFAAIGVTFGAGNGSTTFNLPDLRGQFVRGWSDGASTDSGRAFGSSQSDQNKLHTHAFTGSSVNTNSTGAHTHTVSGTGSGSAASAGAHTHTVSGTGSGSASSGGAHSHDVRGYNTSGATGNALQVFIRGNSSAIDIPNVALSDGAHTHSVTVSSLSATAASNGAHTHSVSVTSLSATAASAGAHTHSVVADGTNSNEGGNEARPVNVALLYCIKY